MGCDYLVLARYGAYQYVCRGGSAEIETDVHSGWLGCNLDRLFTRSKGVGEGCRRCSIYDELDELRSYHCYSDCLRNASSNRLPGVCYLKLVSSVDEKTTPLLR